MMQYYSPCVSLCELDETEEYCMGCKRTQEEIFNWLTYDEETRKQLCEEIEKRTLTKEPKVK